MAGATIRLTIDGHAIEARPGLSLIQAWIGAGLPLSENVGCMGQGVCGACRVMVRRAGERIAGAALACETRVEDGMQVAFLDHFPARRTHAYASRTLADSWGASPRSTRCSRKPPTAGTAAAATPPARRGSTSSGREPAAEGRALAAGAGVRRLRHVQPLHRRLPGAHPAQPPRPVRPADDRSADAASRGSDPAPARDREGRQEIDLDAPGARPEAAP